MLWALIGAAFCRNGIIVNFSQQGARHQQIGGEEFGGGGWMDWGTSGRGLWIAHTIAISLTLPQLLHFFIGQSFINYNATQSLSPFSHFWSTNNFLPQGSGLEFSRDRQELTCQLWLFFPSFCWLQTTSYCGKKSQQPIENAAPGVASCSKWFVAATRWAQRGLRCLGVFESDWSSLYFWCLRVWTPGVWVNIHWLQEKHEFRWCLGEWKVEKVREIDPNRLFKAMSHLNRLEHAWSLRSASCPVLVPGARWLESGLATVQAQRRRCDLVGLRRRGAGRFGGWSLVLKSSARCWETNAVSSILRLLHAASESLNQGSSKLREMQGASTAMYVLRDTDDADVRCGDCLQECTCTRACIYCLYLFIYIYMCVFVIFF